MRWKAAAPLAGVAAIVAFYWWAIVVRRGTDIGFPNGDVLTYFYPLYRAAFGWMAAGMLPLWNPYQLCGIPWLATLQGGFFYPPHVLYVLLPTHLGMAVLSVGHLVLLAVTMAALVMRLGLGTLAALTAGALVGLRGMMPHVVLFPNWLEAAAWLPLGGLAIDRLARGQGARGAALLAATTALSWLAGYPQVTVLVLYAWGGLGAAVLLGRRLGARARIVAVGWAAAAVVVGTLVAAVQLLPARELAQVGERAMEQLSVARMFPMGSVGLLLVPTLITGSLAFGALGLAIAAPAAVAASWRALTVWGLVTGMLAIAIATGPRSPLFALYLWLPALSWFRVPARVLFLADYAFAALAAVGMWALTRPEGEGRRARVVTTGAAVALGSVAAAHGAVARAAVAFAGAVVLAIGLGRPAQARLVPAVLLVLLVAEAFVFGGSRMLLPFDAGSAAMYDRHADTYRALAAAAGSQRVWFHWDGLRPPEMAPRLATLHGVRAIDDYEPLNLRRQAEYFTYVVEGRPTPRRANQLFHGWMWTLKPPRGGASPATRRRLLDLAAVRFAVMTPEAVAQPGVRAFLREAGFIPRPPPGDTGLHLFENPHALPRAYVTYRVHAAPELSLLLRAMSEPSFDPLQASFTEEDPGLALRKDAPRGAPVAIVRDDPHVVEIDAVLDAPGLVVLADAFYPGWKATVDGRSAPILATNHLFRGVAVPAGRHRVRFAYRPRSVAVGAGISLAALTALAGLWVFGVRRGPPRGG